MALPFKQRKAGKLARLSTDVLGDLIERDASPTYAEVVRVARVLQRTGCRVFGMLPAGANVPVPPLALRLAVALQELSGADTAVVDGNLRWPSTLLSEGTGPRHLLFHSLWLRPEVALIAPRQEGPPGAGVPQLRLMLHATIEQFAQIVIDLTGYMELGDHVEAIDLTDGVILVGRAGKTKESELVRRSAALPESKRLGVVLVG